MNKYKTTYLPPTGAENDNCTDFSEHHHKTYLQIPGIQFHFCCQQIQWQQLCVLNTIKAPTIHSIWETAHLSSRYGSVFISTHKWSRYDVIVALNRQSEKVMASVNCSNWLLETPSHWPLPNISFIALKWISPIYIQHQCHPDYWWFRVLHWEEKAVIRKNIAVD